MFGVKTVVYQRHNYQTTENPLNKVMFPEMKVHRPPYLDQNVKQHVVLKYSPGRTCTSILLFSIELNFILFYSFST